VTAYAPEVDRAAGRLDDQLFIACGLAWGAGLLHAVAALGHIHGYVPFTVAFALVAAAQFAWGVALYRRPGRGLLLAGAGLSLAAAGLWIASRTSGLPIGPAPWVAKPVGAVESVATAEEIGLALLALAQLRLRRTGRLARGFRMAGNAIALYLILLSSMLLMPGPAQGGVKGSLVGVPRAGFELLCHPG
jgi:hypothetical protein